MSGKKPDWSRLNPEMFTVKPGIMTPAIRKELAALWKKQEFKVEISDTCLAPLKASIGRLVDMMQDEAERVRGRSPVRAQVHEEFTDAAAHVFAELLTLW